MTLIGGEISKWWGGCHAEPNHAQSFLVGKNSTSEITLFTAEQAIRSLISI